MMPFSFILSVFCAVVLISGPSWGQDRITVFAAASLRDALEEVLSEYTAETVVSYAGSGLTARQVTQGAPAEIVILANTLWADWLAQSGHILSDTQVDLLGNTLVVIGPSGSEPLPNAESATLVDRLDGGRLAIGHTQAVPAGIYAREWLTSIGAIQDLTPHLAETENVRAALALVARGDTPLGIVYASDALAEPAVRVVWEVNPDMHSQITYPMAVVAGKDRPEVLDLVDYLQSKHAARIFETFGFLPGLETP